MQRGRADGAVVVVLPFTVYGLGQHGAGFVGNGPGGGQRVARVQVAVRVAHRPVVRIGPEGVKQKAEPHKEQGGEHIQNPGSAG